ncbi:MAG: TatD family hydrolase [Proteobacteria bacterium]|uniref:TatD family hydrolase n=1 Tax=Ottowia sp. TaxID=1898956 RepID=UPI001D23064B|nr:TatD family hydrolase [Ottowia sp.]MBS0401066.1 TatD family hydrolase [Pseudomonadota bacterium]MBS0415104.1 TatD family hydrolase [Pseudomonadota bacterium]
MTRWIDTHCHLDAPEFAPDAPAVRARAAHENVALCVIPAVEAPAFEGARTLAHQLGDAYALGIHPMYVARAADDALAQLDAALTRHAADPRLVAVGEIGLDYFVPELAAPGPLRARQEHFYREQLKLARRHGLPVILHVRRSVDAILQGLREIEVAGGIAHAFNGSRQQAELLLQRGFRLGFGGALTYERATRLRALAEALPAHAIVMETDAPDIPPQWLYAPAGQRAAGAASGRNEPGELPRIAAELARLRAVPLEAWAAQTTANACAALPRLAALLG